MNLFIVRVVMFIIIFMTVCRPKKALHSKSAHDPPKIVVNTHSLYTQVLQKLFKSFKKIKHFPWYRVIIVIGGSDKNSIYQGKNTETIITTTDNAYDYHGLNQLYRYIDHPLVSATSYMYMHDTCIVLTNFIQKIDSFHIRKNEIITVNSYLNANIMLFEKNVIHNYNTHFQGHMTKRQACLYEHAEIFKFGNYRPSGDRIKMADAYVYTKDSKRTPFFYPCFGIVKFVLMKKYGDITGNSKPTDFKPSLHENIDIMLNHMRKHASSLL